jgi:hypothetical protein
MFHFNKEKGLAKKYPWQKCQGYFNKENNLLIYF